MGHPPERFIDLVRDALINQYDTPALLAHPLLPWIAAGDAPTVGRGRALRQALREAINALYPTTPLAADAAGSWRAWRTYRLLELRYLEGQDVASVMQQVALSKAQYHREHARALEAIAGVLWERWHLDGRWSPTDLPAAPAVDAMPLQREAEDLIHRQASGEAIDVGAVLRGVARVVQPLCTARAVDLRLALPEASISVAGERVALRQALLGLLAPAITSTDHDQIQVALTRAEPYVSITVSGVAAHAQPDDLPGAHESQPFVAALRGRVLYQPARGPGQPWSVCLQLPSGDRPRVLVVDNNPDFITFVERNLGPHGWEVVGATAAEEAVRQVRRCPPRAILLDLVMPERDGWDLLMELKASPGTRRIPVIICSALAEPAVALSLGSAGYLCKPIGEEALVAALAALP